ncbi:MAG: hypothetical protein JJT94_07600 [Bernardetiaceae bacterium]|nr:hypothetical protein [Bernardetiaceae bacterium]
MKFLIYTFLYFFCMVVVSVAQQDQDFKGITLDETVVIAKQEQAFEGIIDYTPNYRLVRTKEEKKGYAGSGRTDMHLDDFIFAYRLYFKGRRIRVDKELREKEVGKKTFWNRYHKGGFNPEKLTYCLHEFIDLDSNMYYRFEYGKVPADYKGEISPEHVQRKMPLSDYRKAIKKVTLLEDSTIIQGRAATSYRIDYEYPHYWQFVWVAKDDSLPYPSVYPPFHHGYSADIPSLRDLARESRVFNDFSDYFQGLILYSETSETHKMNKSQVGPHTEMYEIHILRNIEEKELPDELFEIKIAN